MIRLMWLLKKEMSAKKAAESHDEFNELFNNSRFIHYVGVAKPFTPGIKECMVNVQYMHFRPEDQQSALFFTHAFNWAGRGWLVMSVPAEYKDAVEKISKQCCLEVLKGVPVLNVKGRWETLLPDNGKIFVFDNMSNHPIYRDDPLLKQLLVEAEYETIGRIVRS